MAAKKKTTSKLNKALEKAIATIESGTDARAIDTVFKATYVLLIAGESKRALDPLKRLAAGALGYKPRTRYAFFPLDHVVNQLCAFLGEPAPALAKPDPQYDFEGPTPDTYVDYWQANGRWNNRKDSHKNNPAWTAIIELASKEDDAASLAAALERVTALRATSGLDVLTAGSCDSLESELAFRVLPVPEATKRLVEIAKRFGVVEAVERIVVFFRERASARAVLEGALAAEARVDPALIERYFAALDKRMGAAAPVAKPFDWKAFLAELAKAVAGKKRKLTLKPAPASEIAALEKKLGLSLPPSYRAFLETTNGFGKTSPFIERVRPAKAVDFFRVENQGWIDAYPSEPDDVSEEEHRASIGAGAEAEFRRAYLKDCIQVSDEGDEAVYLLNPAVTTKDGEWEAWLFANWLPGAKRFASFRDLLEAELEEAAVSRDA